MFHCRALSAQHSTNPYLGAASTVSFLLLSDLIDCRLLAVVCEITLLSLDFLLLLGTVQFT